MKMSTHAHNIKTEGTWCNNALLWCEFLIVLSVRHGDGQASRGVDFAEEDVGDGVADLT